MTQDKVRVMKTSDVVRVIAFIPQGHRHTRILVELGSGEKLIFQQATVDSIIRAYVSVALHPSRKACELTLKHLSTKERKGGFAKWQLVESDRSEDEVMEEVMKIYSE